MEFFHKVCCVPGNSIIRMILTFEFHTTTSIPIGVAAITIILIFLSLPVEKQDIKTRIKRIDFAGMSLHCHGFIKSFINIGCVGCALVLSAATLLLLAIDFGGQIQIWGLAAVVVSIRFTRT